MVAIAFENRIPAIRSELIELAIDGETTSYKRLSKIVDMPVRGFWTGVLNQLSREETAAGRPDITHLVINKKTRVTSHIEFESAHKPTDAQRRRHKEILKEIYAFYADRKNRH
jgi:hypothetical protein